MKTSTLVKRTVTVLALSLTTLLAVSANAQRLGRTKAGDPGEWRLIGQVHASQKADHDALIVKGPLTTSARSNSR